MALKYYIYDGDNGTKYAVQLDQSIMTLLKDANGANLTDGHGASPPAEYATLTALQVDEPSAIEFPTNFTPRKVTLTIANLGTVSVPHIDPTAHAALQPAAVATPHDSGYASTAHIFCIKWNGEAYTG